MTLLRFSIEMYPVNEIFYSLQGEGYHTGIPSIFVRFSGCNLNCQFCDTRHQSKTMMSLQEIVSEINKWPAVEWIVLTGGEPSLFINETFVDELKRKTGKKVAIETNGTRPVPNTLDWITLSPKTGVPGGELQKCVLFQCNELKIVYFGQKLSLYDGIMAEHRFLQPCYCTNEQQRLSNQKACVEAVLENPSWRLSLQTHRILDIP